MKVINEWDGAPAQTPTQIIRDWYAEYRKDIEECGIDGFHATELMAALAPLFAAGVWRYDVENAQFVDGSEYLIEYTHPWFWANPASNYRGTAYYRAQHDEFDHPCHGIITRDRIRAFATINTPETCNA